MSTLELIAALQADVQRQAEAFAAKRSHLYTHDGRPQWTDPLTQQNHVFAALAPLRKVVKDALEAAEKAEAEARRTAALGHRDPLAGLPLPDLQRYSLLRPLIAEQVASMLFDDLSLRIRAVELFGDPIEKRCYLEALTVLTGEERSRILGSINRMAESFTDPKAKQAAVDAAQLSRAAAELAHYAGITLAEADGSQQAAQEQRLADYGGAF